MMVPLLVFTVIDGARGPAKEECPFKVGDVVSLKSEGHPMTVTGIPGLPGLVEVSWLSRNLVGRWAYYPWTALRLEESSIV